ncbi:MAG: 30S ribosomal protein S13 [Candidatus Micrarchaeia archaeon]
MAEKTEKKPEKTEKKDAKEAPKEAPKAPPRKIEKNVKGIKRIAGKDVSGDYKLPKALLRVRGIGKSLNQAIAKLLIREMKLPENVDVGDLNDEQIEQMDKILNNLGQYGLPEFMLNRRKDYMEGGNKHIIMNDLIFALKQDVERDKNTYTWKGYRHAYGQKVRGQRTRNTGRVGMTVGVLRKAVLAQAKAATTPGAAQAAKPAAGAPAVAKPAAAPAKK